MENQYFFMNIPMFAKDLFAIFINWLVVWKMNFTFPFSWECHKPNWRTHIFKGVGIPPTVLYMLHVTSIRGLVYPIITKYSVVSLSIQRSITFLLLVSTGCLFSSPRQLSELVMGFYCHQKILRLLIPIWFATCRRRTGTGSEKLKVSEYLWGSMCVIYIYIYIFIYSVLYRIYYISYMYTYAYAYTYTYAYAYACAYIHACINTYIHTLHYITFHTYIHTCLYIYTKIHIYNDT